MLFPIGSLDYMGKKLLDEEFLEQVVGTHPVDPRVWGFVIQVWFSFCRTSVDSHNGNSSLCAEGVYPTGRWG